MLGKRLPGAWLGEVCGSVGGTCFLDFSYCRASMVIWRGQRAAVAAMHCCQVA